MRTFVGCKAPLTGRDSEPIHAECARWVDAACKHLDGYLRVSDLRQVLLGKLQNFARFAMLVVLQHFRLFWKLAGHLYRNRRLQRGSWTQLEATC